MTRGLLSEFAAEFGGEFGAAKKSVMDMIGEPGHSRHGGPLPSQSTNPHARRDQREKQRQERKRKKAKRRRRRNRINKSKKGVP